MLIVRFLVIALACSWTSSALAAAPDDEDFVRFTLEPGQPAASPYHTIRYEITRRRPATTAVHRRMLPGLDEGLHSLGLLTPEESQAFFALAKGLAATSLPSVIALKPGALTWRCDMQLDGVAASFVATDLELLPELGDEGFLSPYITAELTTDPAERTRAHDLARRHMQTPDHETAWREQAKRFEGPPPQ